MVILSLSEVGLSFGAETALKNITFGLNEGDRLGVVGVNGAGKSLLFRIIAGMITPDSGSVHIDKSLKLGYLEQNASLSSNNTIFNEMLLAFPELTEKEMRLSELEALMNGGSFSEEQHLKIANEYTSLEESFRKNGGYEYKSRIKSTLSALGFDEERINLETETLSGGQKTRIALARLLLSNPDILMLDEPTNHLDIPTIEWLEEYLKAFKKTLIVVSHDRYFLDKVTDKTFEIENCEGKLYSCSYSGYVERKKAERETDEKHFELQQKEIDKLEAFIENQRRWGRERNIIAAESRMKAIDRMEKIEKPKSLPQKISVTFGAGKQRLLSDRLLEVKDLKKSYPGKPLFSNLSFELHGGDRLFVYGENGVGKSTLLKILSGIMKADSGIFEYTDKIKIGYFDQEHQGLSPENTVIEELWGENENLKQSEIRGVLAHFLFKADDVFKKIAVLSGGEKARITFAKLMLQDLNLLILDEPTNHLDAQSREALEDALSEYDGTVISVSHDRYFIQKLATRILELRHDGYLDYAGNYDGFVEYIKGRKELESNNGGKSSESGKGRTDYFTGKQDKSRRRKLEKQLSDTEEEIGKLEARLSKIKDELELSASDYNRVGELFSESERLNSRLLDLYAKWDEATSQLSE